MHRYQCQLKAYIWMCGYPYNLKERRINYLHYLANRKDDEMHKTFFQAQWQYPIFGDWTERVKQDLDDFEMEENLDFLRSKSIESLTNIVKWKATEYGLYKYLEKKNGHSKLDNLFYSCFSTQEYLTNSDLTVQQAQLIFKYRVRMANYNENFRGKTSVSTLLGPLGQSSNVYDLSNYQRKCDN